MSETNSTDTSAAGINLHATSDDEDLRLAAQGPRGHAEIIAKYYDDIRNRVYVRLVAERRQFADDVTQRVLMRLWSELSRGRTYAVPFRVVVANIIGWECQRPLAGLAWDAEGEFPSQWDPADPKAEVDDMVTLVDFQQLLDALPERQRQVAQMCWIDGYRPAEIADRLGMQRNAVDQALFLARTRLREFADA